MKRKILFVIVGILLLAAAALIVRRGGGAVQDETPESDYALRCENDGNDLLLTLRGHFPRGSWGAVSSNEEVASLRTRSDRENCLVLCAEPQCFGLTDITLTMENERESSYGYRIVVGVLVDEDGRAQVTTEYRARTDSTAFSGTVGTHEYSGTLRGRELMLCLYAAERSDWSCENGIASAVLVREAEDGENCIRYALTGVGSGVGTLRFVSRSDCAALALTLCADGQGALTLVSHVAEETEPDPTQERAEALLETLGGAAVYPRALSPEKLSYEFRESGDAAPYLCVSMYLTLSDGCEYGYSVCDRTAPLSLGSTAETRTVSGRSVGFTVRGYAFWQERDALCLLRPADSKDSASAERLLEAVREVLESMDKQA